MRKVIHFAFHKVRTLRVSILTLFLSLTVISFIAVLSFTNSGVSKSIQSVSREIAQHLSDDIVEQISQLSNSSDRAVELGAAVFWNMGELSLENKPLMALMVNLVRLNPNITSFYIGLQNGRFLNVIDQSKTAVRTYEFDMSKPLPKETVYSVLVSNASGPSPITTWYYLNADFQVVASESSTTEIFDPRTRPWYLSAESKQGVAWSGFYTFTTGEQGISVSYPIFDANHQFYGVVSSDLTLKLLSNFIISKTIGKTGKAFIVDSSGNVIFPLASDMARTVFTPQIVKNAYQYYLDHNNENDFFLTYNGVNYMTHVSNMPLVFGNQKMDIVIMAPFNEFFSKIIHLWKEVFAIILVILILSAVIVVYFSDRISSPIVLLSKEIDKLRDLQLESKASIRSNVKEIIQMDAAVAAMRRAIRSISRYLPKEIVRELFQKGRDIVLGGEKKEITIFFSDIAGFTPIAESQPIDMLNPLLAEYFDFMSRTILDAGGTIDKYMGDGIMAFWGAPIEIPDHAMKACKAALYCSRQVDLLNEKRKRENKPEFPTRFGINTGTVIVGNIGTKERMNYTVIGDAVNTTFRLQDIDKYYHTKIIISDDVYQKIGNAFVVRPLDDVAVKGRTEKTKIYELMGLKEGEPELMATREEVALARDFTEAYKAYSRGEYDLAKKLFSSVAQKFPKDFCTQIYLQRLSDAK